MTPPATATLGTRIAQLIAAQGPISVAQYMTLALHDAQSGYYATTDPIASAEGAGDFITAPEISQMFGEMLGLWCVEAWRDQGSPRNPRLVELGPGRGTLMGDALRAMRVAPEFFQGLEVVLVEASPVLRAVQQQRLADSGIPIRWTSHFDHALGGRPLFLLANEFFDALPIRQYVRTPRGWCERMVIARDGALAFALAPTPTPPSAIPAARADAPMGGVYEICAAGIALAEELARAIASAGGAALLLDYGHGEEPQGHGETLQAVGRHRFAGLLDDPGRMDLSAHVDFAALAQAGRRGGASVHGPRGQGAFLARLGIAGRAGKLAAANPGAARNLDAAVERLTGPAQMGALFKALAFMPPSAPMPPGFLA